MQDLLNHLPAWCSWLFAGFSSLGALVLTASALSQAFPKDSIAGQWLGWFGSMPLKHRPLPKVEQQTQSFERRVGRDALGLDQEKTP